MLVIFDFDGVVIHSHEVQKKAFATVYQMVYPGEEIPYNQFFRMSGDSLNNIFKKFRLPSELIYTYKKISIENMDMITIHDGILKLLKLLKDNQCHIALCTGKDRKRTSSLLECLYLKEYFEMIVCSDDVDEPKPNPESIYRILSGLKQEKAETILIGDGINDILCANNADIKVIAVTWGDSEREDLVDKSYNFIVDTIEDLELYLRKFIFRLI